MKQHRPFALKALCAAAVLVVAAVATAAATAGGGDGKSGGAKVSALKHQVAALKAQNKKLTEQYTPRGIAAQLAKTKAALAKYESVDAAKADGYTMASPCTFFPGGAGNASSDQGGMGIHFMNDAIVKSGKNIPTKPPILVYAPAAGGALQLVAVEYFKADADQNAKTDPDRPSLFGRAFDGPMLGHSPGMPIHYDLHVWLWKHNPSGIFAPWNPDVSCS
jgi:hypothetical protein